MENFSEMRQICIGFMIKSKIVLENPKNKPKKFLNIFSKIFFQKILKKFSKKI